VWSRPRAISTNWALRHSRGAHAQPTRRSAGSPAAHITVVNDVTLVDFRRRTVFRRRVNPNRRDAVIVEAVRPRHARRVELGVAATIDGRAVWIPNPDADPDLHAAFRELVTSARRTPASWALERPAPESAARLPRLVPVPSA
jgi:hypothetical protein